jgi:hypothetical protein
VETLGKLHASSCGLISSDKMNQYFVLFLKTPTDCFGQEILPRQSPWEAPSGLPSYLLSCIVLKYVELDHFTLQSWLTDLLETAASETTRIEFSTGGASARLSAHCELPISRWYSQLCTFCYRDHHKTLAGCYRCSGPRKGDCGRFAPHLLHQLGRRKCPVQTIPFRRSNFVGSYSWPSTYFF